MRQMKNRQKKGFTLAELLVVVAIIGILVAVSVPMFAAQKNKAVRAVNQANIRSAKAAALNELYGGEGEYLSTIAGKDKNRHYMYFKYSVAEARIVKIYKDGDQTEDGKRVEWNTVNNLAKEERTKAENNKKCDFIYVYVELNNADVNKNGEKDADVQTAPFYDSKGNVGSLKGNDPFGPRKDTQ